MDDSHSLYDVNLSPVLFGDCRYAFAVWIRWLRVMFCKIVLLTQPVFILVIKEYKSIFNCNQTINLVGYLSMWYMKQCCKRDTTGIVLEVTSYLILSYLSRSLVDRWGTTVDFSTNFLHSSRFSAFRSVMFHSRPVHSLMLSSHRFLCLSLRLPPLNCSL